MVKVSRFRNKTDLSPHSKMRGLDRAFSRLFPETGVSDSELSVSSALHLSYSALQDFNYLICKSMLWKVLHCNAETQPQVLADSNNPKALLNHLGKKNLFKR